MSLKLFNLDTRKLSRDGVFFFLITNSKATLTPQRLLIQTKDCSIRDFLMTWRIGGRDFVLREMESRRRQQFCGSHRILSMDGSVRVLLIVSDKIMRRLLILKILLLCWL